ncbi:MAG: RagB/SusD family nutrient uptake outer membrane protein [Odoribacter sp.]
MDGCLLKMNGMNKIIQITGIVLFLSLTACSDKLDIVPTGKIPTSELYKTVDGAMTAMNGIYRSLAAPGWTSSNLEQSWGIMSNNLLEDLMGEDMVQREEGNGWYWYQYSYNVRQYNVGKSWTCYEIWNMWYSTINQTNELIAYTPAATGAVQAKNNVLGQAYAMRALGYFNLIRWFQRTYVGHQQDPGVPIYTEPTTRHTVGKDRGTVEKVYKRINDDLDSAQYYFENSEKQLHKSHIDKYVVYGLKSRVALVQEHWTDAAIYAEKAREKEGLALMEESELFAGFNKIGNNEWMWGMEISDNQATTFATLWAHVDARLPMHAATSRKLISSWLYKMIYPSDVRRRWFVDPSSISDAEEAASKSGEKVRYNQHKFYVPMIGSLAGDYIYMRAAEMLLNEAEARCRLGEYPKVRELLNELMQYKNPVYSSLLSSIPDGKVQTLLSTESSVISNLLDEVLVQRRIELWGEGFRLFDIVRLKSGMDRRYAGSNHPVKVREKPDSWAHTLLIPQSEFDGNINLNEERDQNPIR